LALGGEDNQVIINNNSNNHNLSQITLSEADGTHVHAFQCTALPSNIQFADMKQSEKIVVKQNTVFVYLFYFINVLLFQISALIGKRVLMLIDMSEPDNPINLQFQTRYGDIVAYQWYVYLLLLFLYFIYLGMAMDILSLVSIRDS
jgi:hypothetical protein